MIALFVYASVAAAFLAYAYRRETRLVGEPVPSPGLLAGAVLFLYYIVPPVFYALFPEWSEYRRFYYGFPIETYGTTSFYGLLAIVSLYGGYLAGLRRIKGGSRLLSKLAAGFQQFPDGGQFAAAAIIFLIGMAASFYKQSLHWNHYGGVLSVAERSFSLANNVLTTIESFTWFGFFIFVFLMMSGRLNGTTRLLCILLMGVFGLNCVLAGGAAPLILAGFSVFIYLAYGSHFGVMSAGTKRGVPIFRYGSIALVVVMLAFSFKQVVRNVVNYEDRTLSMTSLSKNFDVLGDIASRTDFSKVFRSTILSLHGSDSLAVIITRLDNQEQEFQKGRMFYLTSISLIPRFLYPDKPDIALGMWFTDNYWRNFSEVEMTGAGVQGTAFLLPGEFYMNFGPVGIPLGMFLVGLLIAWFTRVFFGHPETGIIGFTFVSSLYFMVVHHLFSFASYFSGFVRQFLLTTSLCYLATLICAAISKPSADEVMVPGEALS